jgi:hypothetical protein
MRDIAAAHGGAGFDAARRRRREAARAAAEAAECASRLRAAWARGRQWLLDAGYLGPGRAGLTPLGRACAGFGDGNPLVMGTAIAQVRQEDAGGGGGRRSCCRHWLGPADSDWALPTRIWPCRLGLEPADLPTRTGPYRLGLGPADSVSSWAGVGLPRMRPATGAAAALGPTAESRTGPGRPTGPRAVTDWAVTDW